MRVEINTNYKNIIEDIKKMDDINKHFAVSGKRIFIEDEDKRMDLIELVDIKEDKTVILANSMNLLRDELTEPSNKLIKRLIAKYNR